MGPKWSKMGPKWSKMGPKCPKGVQKGVPQWVPQRSEPKKSRKIFEKKKGKKKVILHGGCRISPSYVGGGVGSAHPAWGGCRIKKVPKKISIFLALIDL